MDKVFLQIINMSITSSYVILFVICVRFLLKKAPKIFSYALWSIVLFRLIFPFSFQSIFSLISINTKTIPPDIIYRQAPVIHSGIRVIDGVINNSLPAPAVGVSVNPMQVWVRLGQTIWLIGIGILILYSIITTIRLSRRLKSARLISHNIFETDSIKIPFVFGIFSPKIYLPLGLSTAEKSYIIKHEEIHIKRFDHIIKPIAFLILSIHWFNPLVWLAFFLMSKDMELSCDENVIKEMGNEIKKDYSNSLLSLSIDRRTLGGCPLAFGENNTKGRIKNILNYKKPKNLVIVIGIIVLIAAGMGLLSNPKVKETETSIPEVTDGLTVEDYANQFIQEEIANYENAEWGGFKIIDSKITKLEKIGTFNEILPSRIEIWGLEYRLKPENIEDALIAGGMNEIDGWITEDTSMGKPILVFSLEGNSPKHLGNFYTGEANMDTLAGQEIALRIMLENNNFLPRETYKGNHVVVQFPLSTGETCQLLLSQPVVQGDKGIWAVERWMDGNGSVYHTIPETDIKIGDYYKELQNHSDIGNNLLLLDPLEVAIDYINNVLGQRQVTIDQIVPKHGANIEDFMETPETHYIGYILELNMDDSTFHLDRIEFLGSEDEERLRELNINPDKDMPNGFYIYNPDNYLTTLFLSDETQYLIVNWEDLSNHKSVTKQELIEHLKEYSKAPPFRIITKGGYVQSIMEQYLP